MWLREIRQCGASELKDLNISQLSLDASLTRANWKKVAEKKSSSLHRGKPVAGPVRTLLRARARGGGALTSRGFSGMELHACSNSRRKRTRGILRTSPTLVATFSQSPKPFSSPRDFNRRAISFAFTTAPLRCRASKWAAKISTASCSDGNHITSPLRHPPETSQKTRIAQNGSATSYVPLDKSSPSPLHGRVEESKAAASHERSATAV